MNRAREILVLVLTVLVAGAILFGFLAFDRNETPERTAQQNQAGPNDTQASPNGHGPTEAAESPTEATKSKNR